jgi:hypothetical protein
LWGIQWVFAALIGNDFYLMTAWQCALLAGSSREELYLHALADPTGFDKFLGIADPTMTFANAEAFPIPDDETLIPIGERFNGHDFPLDTIIESTQGIEVHRRKHSRPQNEKRPQQELSPATGVYL